MYISLSQKWRRLKITELRGVTLPIIMASVGIDIGTVYESATKIGQEFQRIIEQHGQDVVENLLPLVVESLEKLEQVVEEISELHKENSRLSVEASRLQSETEARKRLSKENQVSSHG